MAYGLTNLSNSNGKKYTGENPIIPTTSDIIIPKKTLLKKDLIINGDSNLISDNIKEGISIFGVNGNYSYNKNIDPVESQYAWTKNDYTYSYGEGSFQFLINPDLTVTYYEPEKEQLSRSLLKESDFYDLKFYPDYASTTNYYFIFKSDKTIYYQEGSISLMTGNTWSWDSNNLILKLSGSDDFSGNWLGTVNKSGNFYQYTFLKYVLSDEINAFPEAGVQNEYYYEKIK